MHIMSSYIMTRFISKYPPRMSYMITPDHVGKFLLSLTYCLRNLEVQLALHNSAVECILNALSELEAEIYESSTTKSLLSK